MIPQVQIPEEERYMLQMLAENDIPGLLAVKIERMNGQQRICYEITSRQSLETMFARQGMERQDVAGVMQAILQAWESMREYLLNPADLLLMPSMMYMEPESRQVALCYLPGYGEQAEGERVLAEFILRHLSHQDRAAVDLAYGFYEKISRENAGLAEVIRELLRPKSNEQEKCSGETARSAYPQKEICQEEREMAAPERAEKEPWEDDAWLAEINGEKEESKARRPKRRERSKKRAKRQSAKNEKLRPKAQMEKRRRKVLLYGGIGVAALGVYVLLSWLLQLDLTQMGGLAFLMISVIWLIYSIVTGRRQKNRNHWLEDVGDGEEEDAYMQQLMSEVYAGEEEDDVWEKPEPGNNREEQAEEHYGQTRMLRIGSMPEVVLVSENLRYPNLKPIGEVCLIGKQAQRVDLVLPMHDSLSRIHAKLECTQEGIYITDMNSTNGTKVNGQLITERSRLHPGDHVSFASFSYQVRFTEDERID